MLNWSLKNKIISYIYFDILYQIILIISQRNLTPARRMNSWSNSGISITSAQSLFIIRGEQRTDWQSECLLGFCR